MLFYAFRMVFAKHTKRKKTFISVCLKFMILAIMID